MNNVSLVIIFLLKNADGWWKGLVLGCLEKTVIMQKLVIMY